MSGGFTIYDLRSTCPQERGVHAASIREQREASPQIRARRSVWTLKRRKRRASWTTPCAIRHGLILVLTLLFAGSLHALPSRQAADGIPPLAPPLPEIPPTLWEQYGWLLWIAAPLLLVALALIVWWCLRPGKPPVQPSPVVQARAGLAALSQRPEDGETLAGVSLALRRYLINAFRLPSHEATTTEFCTRLRAKEKIGPELAETLGVFLRNCDERKFSPPPGPAPLGAVGQALRLIELAEARRTALDQPATQTSR